VLIRFRHMIARWKDISEAYNDKEKIESLDSILQEQNTQKKHRLGPQNGPESSGPEKTAKNSKLCEN
jgi:hypothetical protein